MSLVIYLRLKESKSNMNEIKPEDSVQGMKVKN